MSSRFPFFVLLFTLVSLGSAGIYHRHVEYGVPLLPSEQVDTWQIEAKIEFKTDGGPVQANFTLPEDEHFQLLSEHTASPGFGVHMLRDQGVSQAQWSKRDVTGSQTLYYQARLKAIGAQHTAVAEAPETLAPDIWIEPYQSAAQSLIEQAYESSANKLTLAREIYYLLDPAHQNAGLILAQYSRADALVQLFSLADIPVAQVSGLTLEDGRRNQSLKTLLRVYVDGQWKLFDSDEGVVLNPADVLIWRVNSPFLLDLTGGSQSRVVFSMAKQTQSALSYAVNENTATSLFNFSIYQLPIEEQNMFKGILLLPVGALVVVFLRVLIGIKCSGTFMPVLIALAFIQTTLLNGLIGFLAIVSVGLVIRSYLSQLNLLLVSRISAVVLMVIGIIVMFTMIAFKMGLTEGLTITFFPMIILAWTIERMSILWEEEGAKEVMIQGGGSLFVATLVYLMMDNPLVRHWVFNFLGLHLIILAAILILGQYSGYRLLELRRFKPLDKEAP